MCIRDRINAVPKNIPTTLEVLSNKALLEVMFFNVKNKTKEIISAKIVYAMYNNVPIKSVDP